MGLSCSCDDFDKGEHDHWWEPGRRSVPPPGTRCCECAAPLPAEEHACIDHMEVYDPGEIEPRPPHPEDVLDDEPEDFNLARFWAQRYDAMKQAQEDYDSRHGWDSDYERYERVHERSYRCQRCEGLADAIEDLGYCMIGPGDLTDSHTEYVNDASESKRPIVWARGDDGVWNPRLRTPADDRRDARQRFRNRWRYRLLGGGWKYDLRWKVWSPIRHGIDRYTVTPLMRLAGYEWRYDFNQGRMAWRKAGPDDGMQWVSNQLLRDGFEPVGGTWNDKRGGYVWRRKTEKETA